MTELYVYNTKKEVNCITAMLGAEIRNAIQTWRKENKLPIDYRVPTLYVYYTSEIIKTTLIEGVTDSNTNNPHLFELCLIDKVEFVELNENMTKFKENDLVFWSPLGGSVGVSNCLHGNSAIIQKEVDIAIEKGYFNHYV